MRFGHAVYRAAFLRPKSSSTVDEAPRNNGSGHEHVPLLVRARLDTVGAGSWFSKGETTITLDFHEPRLGSHTVSPPFLEMISSTKEKLGRLSGPITISRDWGQDCGLADTIA